MNGSKFLLASSIMLVLLACDDTSTSSPEATALSPGSAQFQTVHAIEQLQQQLQINPNDFAALSRIGDLYFESGQYLLAVQSYDKALMVNPECADCLNDKGLALYYIGDIDGAITSFDQSISIAPDYPNAWLSKGYVLFAIGRYEDAIAPLKQVSAVDSSGRLTQEANKFLAMIEERTGQE